MKISSGHLVMCISDFGWSPNCITVGKVYVVDRVESDYIIIVGNYGIKYRTNVDPCFISLIVVRKNKWKKLQKYQIVD